MRLTCSIRFSFDSRIAATFVGVAFLVLCGCGPNAANTGNSPVTQAKKTPATVAVEAASAKVTNDHPQSAFSSTSSGAINPFFPKSVRSQEKEATVTGIAKANNAPLDVTALLAAGFQGTFKTQTDRLALINNAILEPGKNAEIPVSVNGKTQQIKVHCVRINRNSAVVTMAGRSEPIELTLKTTTGIVN